MTHEFGKLPKQNACNFSPYEINSKDCLPNNTRMALSPILHSIFNLGQDTPYEMGREDPQNMYAVNYKFNLKDPPPFCTKKINQHLLYQFPNVNIVFLRKVLIHFIKNQKINTIRYVKIKMKTGIIYGRLCKFMNNHISLSSRKLVGNY